MRGAFTCAAVSRRGERGGRLHRGKMSCQGSITRPRCSTVGIFFIPFPSKNVHEKPRRSLELLPVFCVVEKTLARVSSSTKNTVGGFLFIFSFKKNIYINRSLPSRCSGSEEISPDASFLFGPLQVFCMASGVKMDRLLFHLHHPSSMHRGDRYVTLKCFLSNMKYITLNGTGYLSDSTRKASFPP